MNKRQNSIPSKRRTKLLKYFIEPTTSGQKQYEAVRAFIVEQLTAEEVAKKFGYTLSTVYSLVKKTTAGKLKLFPKVEKGPKGRRIPIDVQNKIIQFRKRNLSAKDIEQKLAKENISISKRTIARVLLDAGFKKLKRRTNRERGITKKNKLISKRSGNLNFKKLEPFKVDCPVVGVYFFLPYIIESGILDIVKKCNLPGSNDIGSVQASLSMLLLKLIGNERLSHIKQYDHEPGLGIFAGLNRLPKPTYMGTYSCNTSEPMLLNFQEEIINLFRNKYPNFYNSKFINLDFHSIPHYGDQATMERVWCGSKGKTIKGANTVFAQDSESNVILYTRADILRKEESEEIKNFVSYWKKIKGKVDETLVFDCKFTRYDILDELASDQIKFITLQRRYKKLVDNTDRIPKEKWLAIKLEIPKRKHNNILVYTEDVILKGCKNKFRRIIIKDHGRERPTFIITNDYELDLKTIITVYAKRWRIENKFAELVSFFNLNALSSSLMIRIHFDILWTMIADTLYKIFAQELRRSEEHIAPTIFKDFINMPGRVEYDGEKFVIKIRKRAPTPILKSVDVLCLPINIKWLNNKPIEIIWRP